MAEIILLNIASNILWSLGSYASQQIGLPWRVKEELRKMENNVSTVKNILLDAQERQMSNLAVKEWLQRLKLILYDADDLLDEVTTETRIRQGENWMKKVHYFTSSNPLVFSYVVNRRFKDVGKRLDEIVLQMHDFQFVVKLVERPIETIRREETSSSMNTPTMIVGREDDKNNLVSLLLSSHYEENVPIIPVVGMGGLGKTTLLQLVYNDNRIENHFTKRLWVYISTDFDIKTILMKILQAGGGNVDSSCINGGLHQLQNRVKNMLGDTNFFLVLDDVWNEDRVKWKNLEDFFITLPRGSRIVVTTRSNIVASIVRTTTVEKPYKLKGLPDSQCLDILVKWAFKEGDEGRHPNLVNIGREIVKKCGGVPLAARTLGALLFLKTNQESDWLSVRDSEMWALVQSENDILPILRLSYDQMPSYLKQCFAYCSLFEKNEVIDGKKLIYAWMAHGFVQCSHKREELEYIGERYILELLRRSFLEPYDGALIFTEPGRNELYKMHDLVHDLAQYVAGNECLSIRADITETILDTVRHISLYRDRGGLAQFFLEEGWFARVFDWDIPWKFPRPLTEAKKLRTILCPTKRGPTFESSEPEIGSSRCLRVLEGCHLASKSYMPEKIGKLKLLRYLSIGGVEKLPKSFCNLLNLQYLDLPQSNMVKLPKDFGKLINLRFLSFSTELTCLPKEEIGGLTSLRTLIICQSSNLRSLGEGIEHLSCLRELVLDRCSELVSLPAGFRHLTSLERLEMNSCHCFDFSNDDLKGLKSLKKLKVYNLPRLVNLPEGIQDAAASLTHLEILGCTNFTSPSEFVLPKLRSLQSLRISYCPEVRSLPEGMQCLTNLQFLSIVRCNLCTSSYKQGGEDWLKVAHVPNIDFSFEPFSKHSFEIYFEYASSDTTDHRLVNLPEGIQDAAALLTRSEILGCTHFTSPSEFIVPNLLSLQSLRISCCPEVQSLPQGMQRLTNLQYLSIVRYNLRASSYKQGGEDWPKVAHIPSIDFFFDQFSKSSFERSTEDSSLDTTNHRSTM